MNIATGVLTIELKALSHFKTKLNLFYRKGYTQFSILTAFLLLSANTQAQQTDYAPSHLGPFEQQLRTDNPLREPFSFNFRPAPTAVDIDNDGDIDIAVADYDGGNGFHLLRNDGTPSSPAFNRAVYLANPFGYVSFDDGGTLAFTDIDGDADLDMLFGTIDGSFRFYKRTNPTGLAWTRQTTAWSASTKSGDPMFGVNLDDFTSPVFNDMDNDGDLDLVIGSSYLSMSKSMHYYVNDGQFNYSASTLTGINPNLAETTPTFLDVDRDGDEDIVIGAADGNLYYFKRTGTTSFEEQTGSNNPFAFFNRGGYSSPTAADFDNDGDKDLVVGVTNNYFDFAYIENKGAGLFEEKTGFDNPLGGVSVISESAPYFTDLDNDGDKDLVVGSSDNADPYLLYYRNDNGKYTEITSNNPFTGATVSNMFVPSFVDIDGDGDKDLLATADNTDMTYVDYFKNESGTYVRQDFSSGPFAAIQIQEGRGDFADIDKDGDFDFIVADRKYVSGNPRYFIRFFENTGSTTAAAFTERLNAANPLNDILEDFELFPRLIDIDHDGDLDALIGEGGNTVELSDGNEFLYYENISTTNTPQFVYRGDLIDQGSNPFEPAPSFIDQDNDGDLDIFYGTISGDLIYFKNTNPAATISINSSDLTVAAGTEVAIDPLLALADADNDSIVTATVAIAGFLAGQESLSFTAVAGITGSFNNSTGVLRFFGKAPVADYQTILRSVELIYNSAVTNGRLKPSSLSLATTARTITIDVSDADGTNSTAVTRTINFTSSSAPTFANQTITTTAGASATLPLATLISDDNNDVDLTTLTVTQQPASGAPASITTGNNLVVNYQNRPFVGVETVQVQVCDLTALCTVSTITVNVTNTSPTLNASSTTIPYRGIATVNLQALVSDSESNIDLSSFSIVASSTLGGNVSVSGTNLVANYAASNNAGTDIIRVRVCDVAGACAENNVSITIQNGAPVIAAEPLATSTGASQSLNLLTVTSDADGNLDASTFTISQAPLSGAKAQIQFISSTEVILNVDYSGIVFSGNDQLTVRACDAAGACTESVITIMVNSEIEVYNAVAPNSAGDNKFFRILNLPSNNKVVIFNRWGDAVYEADGYNNESVKFEGFGQNGNALSSGTYFYKIEYYDQSASLKTLTGYLSLKQ